MDRCLRVAANGYIVSFATTSRPSVSRAMLSADHLLKVLATKAGICNVLRSHAESHAYSTNMGDPTGSSVEIFIPVGQLHLDLPPPLTWHDVATWHQDKARGFETFVYDGVARTFRATVVKPVLPPPPPLQILPLTPAPRPPAVAEPHEIMVATVVHDAPTRISIAGPGAIRNCAYGKCQARPCAICLGKMYCYAHARQMRNLATANRLRARNAELKRKRADRDDDDESSHSEHSPKKLRGEKK